MKIPGVEPTCACWNTFCEGQPFATKSSPVQRWRPVETCS